MKKRSLITASLVAAFGLLATQTAVAREAGERPRQEDRQADRRADRQADRRADQGMLES